MIILGIETSCDETSAAVLKMEAGGKPEPLSFKVSSSVKEQAKYGGIVPEVAARKQIEYVLPVIAEAIAEAKNKLQKTNNKEVNSENLGFDICDLSFVDAIAVTVGPGLAASLQVGIDAAKSLAYVWQKPLIPVNHLEGHLLSPLITKEKEFSMINGQFSNKSQTSNDQNPQITFPAIGLIVSGGHTELVLVKDYGDYELIGRTRDDAAGEAFDKVAKLLDLGYPGGPIIDKLAKEGNPTAFDFPRGMMHSDDFDFSFSGLKTAVLYTVQKDERVTSEEQLPNVTASFVQAVVDVLVAKVMRAVEVYGAQTVLLGGGVAASPNLRDDLTQACNNIHIPCVTPLFKFTGDNAAMIALAGYYRYVANEYIQPDLSLAAWQTLKVTPNLKLT